jgi:hypothetical protein
LGDPFPAALSNLPLMANPVKSEFELSCPSRLWNQEQAPKIKPIEHLQDTGVMRADPNECREHAERCRQMARSATTAEARASYLETAHSWEQLAAEIEGAQAFIRTMAEIVGREPDQPGQPARAEPEAA